MSFLIEFCVFSFSVFILVYILLINKKPPSVLNIYRRPNGFFWLKFCFMYILLSSRKWIYKTKPSSKKTEKFFQELDKPQKLSQHPNAVDAVYFNGANKSGDYLVVGTARRKNKLIDGFLYLLIESSGLGVLETPKLPSTALYQIEETEKYEVEGISLVPVEPMKKWRISYDGKMKRHAKRSDFVDVRIEAEWTSNLPVFNFDTDIDPVALAKATALENFSRDYFESLKKNHQSHYEQHGDVKGTVTINGHIYDIDINALRDHTIGQREWRNFHRYALHFVTTSDGDRIHIGVVCMPTSFSCLTIGYVYSHHDKEIYPVKSCDLQLYQHGEDGNPPLDYAFTFEAGNKRYIMQVNVIHSPHFYISKDWECKIVERLCTFEVNNVKGWGAAEWQYRNVDEKNAEKNDTDFNEN